MWFITKRLIQHQMAVYCAHRERMGQSTNEAWINLFVKFTDKENILDVDGHELLKFERHVGETMNGYAIKQSGRAIENFRRYYTARGKNLSHA